MSSRLRRRSPALATALVALATGLVGLAATTPSTAVGQVAQRADQGSFGINPARRDLVGRPPARLVPTIVKNTTAGPYTVHVFAALLSQDISGAFTFEETPRNLNAAKLVLAASPTDFTLAPGEQRSVDLRWQLLARGSRTAYVGVIFQGAPQVKDQRSVGVISRLLSINFFRLPGKYHARGAFTALHAVQFAPRVLRFLPRVRNTGDVVAKPEHTRFAIRDATGRTVFKTRWVGDVILPHLQREFPIDVTQILPAGSYTAVAAMSFGGNHHAKISTPFTLVGPNQLPTPSVAIRNLNGTANIGEAAQITAQVASTGTSPVSLNLDLSLFPTTSGAPNVNPIATRRVVYTSLAPGSTQRMHVELGHSLRGSFRIVAHYVDPTGASQTVEADFTATHQKSFWDRFKDFLREHTVLLIVLLALLIIAGVAYVLLRRQRRLEAALRAVSAGAGPGSRPATVLPPGTVPPSGTQAAGAQIPRTVPAGAVPRPPGVVPPTVPAAAGVVDLGTATVDQLETLPGVGPAAARRIVAFRDEYGLRSVDDLLRVEGFDAERVGQLRGLVRV